MRGSTASIPDSPGEANFDSDGSEMTTRRVFCLAIGGALSGGWARDSLARGSDVQVPHSAGTAPPKLEAPENAADCHMHVYDSRFPYAEGAVLRPPEATVDDYRLLQRRIGTTRVVVVTPSTYGTDNRCTVDAVRKLGPAARGIAVVDSTVTDRQLRDLADAGIRGIRFNLAVGAVTSLSMLEPLSRRVHALGWHVQLNIPPEALLENEALLQRLPSPVVFDHLARVPLSSAVENEPTFVAVRRLIEHGNAWVKLSGAYLGSRAARSTYADTHALGRALVAAAPERVVWGSDWPHPTIARDSKPDDAVLFDLLEDWADGPARRRILVSNPEALYGF